MQWLSRFSAPAAYSSGGCHRENTQARPCLIVASRPDALSPRQAKAILERIEGQDPFVIGADGGARVARALGLNPHLIIGDMDSLGEDKEQFRKDGCDWVLHRAEKDETDTHLALGWAFSRGYRDLTIVFQRTGRLDHVMSAIFVGAGFVEAGASVRYVDASFEAMVIKGPAEMCVRSDTRLIVSLLPLTPSVSGITLKGMKYPLRDEPLALGESRGTSNETVAPEARVAVREGLLLVLATDQE